MSSRGVNKAIILGHVGKDPEIRFMPGGDAVTNISIATSESWNDKQTGQKQERTEWHRTVFYGKLAEIVGEYVKKGSKIYVEGQLRTRKWQDKEGKDHYTTEIIGKTMQMLDSRSAENTQQNGPRSGAAPKRGGSSHPSQAEADFGEFGDFDQDIPF